MNAQLDIIRSESKSQFLLCESNYKYMYIFIKTICLINFYIKYFAHTHEKMF